MILDEIKLDSVNALKESRKTDRSVLTTLLSQIKNKEVELRAKGQNLADADIVSVIQKFTKELQDEIDAFNKAGRKEKVLELEGQLALVKSYLPKMLTEDEIKSIILGLDDKSIKNVMTHFKTNYAGQVDMSLVSKIARSI